MAHRLGDLAGRVAGEVLGEPGCELAGLASLDEATPGDLSFCSKLAYREQALASRAGALLVTGEVATALAEAGDERPLLVVEETSAALVELIELFHPPPPPPSPGVHPTAIVGDGCQVDAAAHLGPYVVLGAGSRVAAGAVIHAHVVVGRGCRVGEEAVLHPHVTLYDGTVVGPRAVVHGGATIGSDGFGYASGPAGHAKLAHVGRAVIEADVEIGANSAIDRALLDETRIGAGSKIDNLVQVGHNVRTGRSCLLCGQAGVAGSTELGDFVVLGGQAGIIDHIAVGDGVQVAAKSAVYDDVPAGQVVAGIPAGDIRQWRRRSVLITRLGEMARRLRALEKRLAELPPGDQEGE